MVKIVCEFRTNEDGMVLCVVYANGEQIGWYWAKRYEVFHESLGGGYSVKLDGKGEISVDNVRILDLGIDTLVNGVPMHGEITGTSFIIGETEPREE